MLLRVRKLVILLYNTITNSYIIEKININLVRPLIRNLVHFLFQNRPENDYLFLEQPNYRSSYSCTYPYNGSCFKTHRQLSSLFLHSHDSNSRT